MTSNAALPETSYGSGTTDPRRGIEDRFINEWGLLANAWGVSPLLGRIHGLLLLAGRPMTAEEVCERLDISRASASVRPEEHTSELQSQFHLVCRLLLEKKKKKKKNKRIINSKKTIDAIKQS